jgi:anti-sigma factor RsiW
LTARVVPLNASDHAAVDALLPWYVNGTLKGDELQRVEQHLAACAACRQEIAWLRDVFGACVAAAPLPEAPAAEAAGMLYPRQWSRQQAFRTKMQRGWQSTPRWMRVLMAAQLAGVAILGTLLAGDAGDNATFRTLGSPGRFAPSGEAIAVMFDPAITEAELRAVVGGIGGRLVDGPTTTNAYVLEVPAGRSSDAVEKLRAESKVRLAEPLGPRPERTTGAGPGP